MDKTTADILVVDLTSEDQKYLVDVLLPQDIDVNIWSWNSAINTDTQWLLNCANSADQIILRFNSVNNLASWIVSKSNSFYLTGGQVNILDSIAKNTVSDIKEVKLYGIREL